MRNIIQILLYVIIFLHFSCLRTFCHPQDGELESIITKNLPKSEYISATTTNAGFLISLDSDFLFQNDEINPKSEILLCNLSLIIKISNKNIIIEGYHSEPNLTEEENFEKSIIYAQKICDFFLEHAQLNAENIDIYGYGIYYSPKTYTPFRNYINIEILIK